LFIVSKLFHMYSSTLILNLHFIYIKCFNVMLVTVITKHILVLILLQNKIIGKNAYHL